MSIEIYIDTHGLTNIASWFDELAGDTDTLIDDILMKAANYQTRSTKRNFGKQRGPDGVPWKPLKPLTIGGRKKGRGQAGRGYKRLLSSGALRQGIAPMSPRAQSTTERSIMIGTNQPYAKWQQKGFSSVITSKQAWWMVCNLIGYDPKKPEALGEEAFGELRQATKRWTGKYKYSPRSKKARKRFWHKRKRTKIYELTGKTRKVPFSRRSDKYKAAMGSYGKKMAYLMWRKLVGSTLRVPATPFIGFSEQDGKEIGDIAQRSVDRFLRKRQKI